MKTPIISSGFASIGFAVRFVMVAGLAALPAVTAWGAGDSAPATTAKAADAPASSYEALAKGATRTRDVATLLGAFVDRCDNEKRDLERARCRTTQAYLRGVLP